MLDREFQGTDDTINLNHVLWVLKRHRGLLFFCLIIGISLSYLFLSFVAPKFKASAQLIFEPGAEQVIGPESGLVPTVLSARSLERVIALLESPSILKQVALKLMSSPKAGDALGPDATAIQVLLANAGLTEDLRNQRLVQLIQKDLSVKTEAAQQIITIEYKSRSAREAADVANLIVQTFMQDRAATRQAAIAQATRWLDAQLTEAREKLAVADKKLETYKAQHRLDNEAAAAVAAIQLRELQREREAIKTLYESMLAKVAQTATQQTLASSEFRVLVDAVAPEQPTRNPLVIWIAGCAAGIGFGIALTFALEFFNDTLVDLDNIEKKISINILARAPVISHSDFTDDDKHPYGGELSRHLRFAKDYPNSLFTDCLVGAKVAIGDLGDGRTRKAVMITSPMPGEGKTHISTNLASVSALLGEKTLLIDLDVRKEPLPNGAMKPNGANGAMKLNGANGAAHSSALGAFLDSAGISQFMTVTYEEADYDVIRPKPSEGAVWLRLLQPQMHELLKFARQNYDRVWIDTAPAQVFADASILAKQTDGVVLVAEWSRTTAKQLKDTSELIRSGGGDVVGVIINKVKVDKLISAAMVSYKDYYAGLNRRRRHARLHA